MSGNNPAIQEHIMFRLQPNLPAIRKLAGLTTEQMGDKIGVFKRIIGNLANSKSPMRFE
jgi:transcriptional regulator with XRE-family HTH domain